MRQSGSGVMVGVEKLDMRSTPALTLAGHAN